MAIVSAVVVPVSGAPGSTGPSGLTVSSQHRAEASEERPLMGAGLVAVTVQGGEDQTRVYSDVGDDHHFVADIERLASQGVFDGTDCAEGRFCPADPMKRWVVAVWMVRAFLGGDPPPVAATRFDDVEAGEWWAPYVEELADWGVTGGCRTAPLRFCPDGTVTRAQMASFISRALNLDGAPVELFADAGETVHREDIVALAAAGITGGCRVEPLRFCPSQAVTRGQMAAFVSRALDLGTRVRTASLAPLNEDDFKARVAPYGLSAHNYFLVFGDDGRFEEYADTYSVAGRFEYRATGPDSGVLEQTYDGGIFGGSCTTTLSFRTRSAGALDYQCADGSTSRQGWQIADLPLRAPPTLESIAQGSTDLQISFVDSFEANETRAYDYEVRIVGEQGPWASTCDTITNHSNDQIRSWAGTRLSGLLPGTGYNVRYRYRGSSSCGASVDRPWSHTANVTTQGVGEPWPPRFLEGSATTRFMPENAGPAMDVGLPVSAQGTAPLAYSLEGPDADSFLVLSGSGQIRTISGPDYDHETKSRYRVTVRAVDSRGDSATIDVDIILGDLEPPCASIPDLRLSAGDRSVIARWSPPQRQAGQEAVLGYHIQLRLRAGGSWGDDRIVAGPQLTAAAYSGLTNGQGYQVRVRPVGNEGQCSWTQSEVATPTDALAPSDPQDLVDRLDQRWIGTPDHHLRLLTAGRCRYVSNNTTSDAYCNYRRISPNTGEITLEFDDPSRGSCGVSLAFSSLTAGSFVDECWEAGVNTEPPSEFLIPPRVPRTAHQLRELISRDGLPTIGSAPEDREEFLRFARGRTDLIPGVIIGSFYHRQHSLASLPDAVPSPEQQSAEATVTEYDSSGRSARSSFHRWEYAMTGPSRGLLTLVPNGGGDSYQFSLDFNSDGTLGITVTDGSGDGVDWMDRTFQDLGSAGEHVDVAPVLLLSPPIEPLDLNETDFAPADSEAYWNDHYHRFPDAPSGWRDAQSILGDTSLQLFSGWSSHRYSKTGHNRARISVTLGEFDPDHPARDHSLPDAFYEQFEGAVWEIDLEFLSEDFFRYSAELFIDGVSTGLTSSGVADHSGGRTEAGEFPPEVVPPDEPPQERGEDIPDVEAAPAGTTSEIGGDDLQPFLMRDTGVRPVSYQPGDWLEPKDGGNQRMMIVGVTQVSAPDAGGGQDPVVLAGGLDAMAFLGPDTPEQFPIRVSSQTRLTLLQVVCMQFDKDIPTRGARYFSKPKQAESAEQLCQRDCVLSQSSSIQQCVWQCQEES